MSASVQTFPRAVSRYDLIPMTPRETLEAFHRGADALVNVEGADSSGAWHILASMTTAELFSSRAMTGRMAGPQLYFGLASTYRAVSRKDGKSVPASFPSAVTGLTCYRRERGLQYLNAVSVDIDAHDGQPFDFDSQVQDALNFTVKAGLPFPSVVCNSGRGLWLHWLLTDRPEWNGKQNRPAHHPPGAYSNLRRLHSRILRAVVKAYSGLGAGKADTAVTDSQRVARFPGSMNAASGTRCEYFRVSDTFYTLHQMADSFGVRALPTRLTPEDVNATECTGQPSCKCSGQRWDTDTGKVLKPVCLSRMASAGLARWQRPLSGLRQLAEIRGQFSKGQRHKALYLFAVLARRARATDLQGQAFRFAANYCSALSHAAVLKCLKAANKNTGKIRNVVIADWLTITDAELSQITGWLTPARPAKGARRAKIEARRAVLLSELSQDPKLSIRKAMFILERAGFKSSVSRLSVDLRTLRRSLNTCFPVSPACAEDQTQKIPASVLICMQGSERHSKATTGTSTETGISGTAEKTGSRAEMLRNVDTPNGRWQQSSNG